MIDYWDVFNKRWLAVLAPEATDPVLQRSVPALEYAAWLCWTPGGPGARAEQAASASALAELAPHLRPLGPACAQALHAAVAKGTLLRGDLPLAAHALELHLRVVLLIFGNVKGAAARSSNSAKRVAAFIEAALPQIVRDHIEHDLRDGVEGQLWRALHLVHDPDDAGRDIGRLAASLRAIIHRLAARPHNSRALRRAQHTLTWLWCSLGFDRRGLASLRALFGLLRGHQVARSRRERAKEWLRAPSPTLDGQRGPTDQLRLPRPRARRLWFLRPNTPSAAGGLRLRRSSRYNQLDVRGAQLRIAKLRTNPADALALELLKKTDQFDSISISSGNTPATRAERSRPKIWRADPKGIGGPMARLLTLARSSRYHRFSIAKARGGERLLEVPEARLMLAQRDLARWLAQTLEPTHPSCAFVPGRNVVVHAAAHAGAHAAVQLDIHDFFNSVTAGQLVSALSPDPHSDDHPFHAWSRAELRVLVRLCVRKRDGRWSLPQGAPTSPALSNAAAGPMDHRIRAAGNAAFGPGRWTYTRYADDLVISTREVLYDFANRAEAIARAAIGASGWAVNEAKVSRWSRADRHPLVICGLTVGSADQPLSLSREAARRSRAALSTALDLELKRRRTLCPDTDEQRSSRSRAEGALSWAYTATADLRWLALTSANVQLLAHTAALATPSSSPDDLNGNNFLIGWLGGLAPQWAVR